MSSNKIKTICFDISAVNREDVDVCSTAIRDIDLAALFDSVIDEMDDGTTWRRVDSLEIDLGNIDFTDIFELRQSLVTGFRRALSEQRFSNTSSLSIRRIPSLIGRREFYDDEPVTSSGRSLEILIYYLQHGTLPWYVHERSLDIRLVLNELLSEAAHELKRSLLTVIENRRVSSRLATIFDKDTNLRLLEVILDVKDFPVVYEIIQLAGKYHHSHDKFIRQFFSQLYRFADNTTSQNKRIHIEPGRVVTFLRGLSVEDATRIIEKIEMKMMSDRNVLLAVFEQIEYEIVKGINRTTTDEIKPVQEEERRFDEKGEDEGEAQTSEHDELYIENSGLVILNAGLISQYFATLGWVADKKFVSEEVTNKAVLWLHYVAQGDDQSQEYDLALNKIICGIDPADVVDPRVVLSEQEKQSATELLETILAHWTAPGKISIQALRQTFLLRKGRLTIEEGGWHLHVESHTWDILLERLPWTFSVFRLPWMTKPIYTQWQTRI